MRASRREAIDRRLDLAGRPGGLTVQRYVGMKSSLLLIGLLLSALLVVLGGTPLIALLLCAMGWFGPDIYLSREGRLRQERIERDLPDFLDILAVTVRAGLGYRLALGRVSDALGGPGGRGDARRPAPDVARRQPALGLRGAARAQRLRAADELRGRPAAGRGARRAALGGAQRHRGDMRRAAHQAARRRAARATPRVSLIITSLIVPGTMILILVSIILGSGLGDSGLLD